MPVTHASMWSQYHNVRAGTSIKLPSIGELASLPIIREYYEVGCHNIMIRSCTKTYAVALIPPYAQYWID